MAKPKTNTHAVVGSGDEKVTKEAISECLKDVLSDGDVVSVLWQKPVPPAVSYVYDYILDNEVLFQMFYEEGENPSRVFRESSHGSVFKVRSSIDKTLESITGEGKVLFLWNDEEVGIDPAVGALSYVFDNIAPGTVVLELTNGLAPITMSAPTEPEPATSRYDDEEEPADTPAPEPVAEGFTKAELENMPARAVKAYGEKKGAKAKTASGIIAELFSDEEDREETPEETARNRPLMGLEESFALTEERIESIQHGIQQAHEGKTTPAEPFITNLLIAQALQEVVAGLTSLIEALTPDSSVE